MASSLFTVILFCRSTCLTVVPPLKGGIEGETVPMLHIRSDADMPTCLQIFCEEDACEASLVKEDLGFW